ncbi:MAG: smc 3 [Firmicutes bacterium]|nr:smc 3 [Bacillota bacterium]
MYGIVLIFVLIIMGGAIAYIGDKLGTKVGKKKLSIFGLRPKHTSIIVTIITGILITSSTLGVLALTSKNVRVALFGMEKLNQQIRETESSLQTITLDLAKANAEREDVIAALDKTKEDYRIASEKSEEQIQELENKKNILENKNNTLEQARQELDERVASLSEQQKVLENDIERLNVLTKRLNQGIQFVREGDIIYRAGEVIVTGTVNPREDKSKNTEALTEILNTANQTILARFDIKENIDVLWVSKETFEQTLGQLNQSNQEMVVRVVAAGNIVYGEPVRVNLELYPNKQVYKENQVVYKEVMTFGGKEKDAEKIVLDFLKKVNAAAVSKGMIPDPLQGTIGVMGGSQFYDIVNALETAEGRVELTAVAGTDTNAAGPLRLNVRVKNLQ